MQKKITRNKGHLPPITTATPANLPFTVGSGAPLEDASSNRTGMHNPRAGSGPEGVLSSPQSRLKNTRIFSWMMEILWMNLNFIELLTILQLITIQNSSDS